MIFPSRAIPVVVALAGALLWSGALAWHHQRGDIRVINRFEAILADIRFGVRGERTPPANVTIVAIDDATAKRDGGFPVARSTLAQIVDAVARRGPRAIVLDILLVDAGNPVVDSQLAGALAKTPSVIASAAVFDEAAQFVPSNGSGDPMRVPIAERFLHPLDIFANVAASGVVNVTTDRTGTPRLIPLLFRTSDRLEASLPLRAVSIALGQDPVIEDRRIRIGDRTIPTDWGHQVGIDYYGPRGTIRTVSAAEILDGALYEAHVRDGIVVIGGTVTGGGDVFPTPFDPVLPGVEVIATGIANMSADNVLVRDHRTRLVDAATAILLALGIVALLALRGSVAGFLTIAAILLAWGAFNMAAFASGFWLNAALPVAAAAPPAIVFGSLQLWLGRRRAGYLATQSELLQRFSAPRLRRWMADHPDFLAEPVRQDAAIVFIDISGYTALSETLGAAQMRDLLDSFFHLLNEEVEACGGTVTSFMGDGAMIVFGLPEAKDDDAFRAARCAAALGAHTRQWVETLPTSTAARIGFKIGAHFGAIIASRLGGGSHEHITATGDTVNVAARLMEVAAARGADMAVSGELLRAAGPECALYRAGTLGEPRDARIRGRVGALSIRLWRADMS